MSRQNGKSLGIQRVGYRPPERYQLDLEILSASELRQRVHKEFFRSAHRIEFHLLVCVTRGSCAHVVDFKPVECKPGSLLILRPGQTQQFDMEHHWEGWLAIFQPEFLLPLRPTASVADLQMVESLEALPEHLVLGEDEGRAVIGGLLQMRVDAKLPGSSPELHGLLRHQLCALLLRLYLASRQQQANRTVAPLSLQRFKRFKQLVEEQFPQRHQVAEYANQLGCSEKSLTRATMEAAGVSAKEYITARINLEAKRLLVHTSLAVALIADRVGFDEATNFVKFFRRDVGCSPGEFRRRQAGRS